NWRGRAVLEAMGAASRLGRQRDRPVSLPGDASISGDQPGGGARGEALSFAPRADRSGPWGTAKGIVTEGRDGKAGSGSGGTTRVEPGRHRRFAHIPRP